MVRLSEDPKYGFAVGRIRALEPALMDRARYERFIRSRSGGDFVAALAESTYGRHLEAGSAGVAQALDAAAKENVEFFSAYALDDWLLRLFSLPVAFRNLRTAVKAALARGENAIAIPKEVEGMPLEQHINETVRATFAAFATDRDAAEVDMALDRLAQRVQLEAARPSEFMTGYFGLHADTENLRTLARLKLSDAPEKEQAGEMRAAFLEGGALAPASLLSALPQPWEAIVDLLGKAPPLGAGSEEYREFLGNGRAAADRRSFIRLERLGRELELRYLRQTRYATFGYEPLVTFFLLRENELRNLRLLYAAKLTGVAEEEAQELVAYVD